MCSKKDCIFLIGLRASGKSSLGKALAQSLGWAFKDTDRLVQSMTGKTIEQIIETQGWDAFRQLECQALQQAYAPFTIIATGGGVVLASENRNFMQSKGLVLYLFAQPEVLVDRLAKAPMPQQRPNLPGCVGKSDSPELAEMRRQFNARQALYLECAHMVLDAHQALPTLVSKAKASV